MFINKFDKIESSFFRKIENILGEKLIPVFEYDEKANQELLVQEKKLQAVLEANKISLNELNNALLNGFDLAAMAGPLMDEPMQGAVFIIEDFDQVTQESEEESKINCGPFSG